ncbi:hypothetical protein D9757_009365 [Collybiopsis confluens]|uniref:Uncharacterized protein n=1 Tax=Collybiopsis confluens TaxID=2823264 RepID=A0A8H5H6W5_9AGAR|nr:hypothetical protein D9757_009365 [Collybiopsis confluens]
MGRFFQKSETRPYIRVLQAMSQITIEGQKYQQAVSPRPNAATQMASFSPLGRSENALYFRLVFLDIFVDRMPISELPAGGGTRFLPPRRGKSALYTTKEQKNSAVQGVCARPACDERERKVGQFQRCGACKSVSRWEQRILRFPGRATKNRARSEQSTMQLASIGLTAGSGTMEILEHWFALRC